MSNLQSCCVCTLAQAFTLGLVAPVSWACRNLYAFCIEALLKFFAVVMQMLGLCLATNDPQLISILLIISLWGHLALSVEMFYKSDLFSQSPYIGRCDSSKMCKLLMCSVSASDGELYFQRHACHFKLKSENMHLASIWSDQVWT